MARHKRRSDPSHLTRRRADRRGPVRSPRRRARIGRHLGPAALIEGKARWLRAAPLSPCQGSSAMRRTRKPDGGLNGASRGARVGWPPRSYARRRPCLTAILGHAYAADAASARRWTGSWRACGRVGAGCWCCEAIRDQQDSLVGVPRGARERLSHRERRVPNPRWSFRSRGCISCARRCSTGSTPPGPAARRSGRLRAERRRRAGSLPRRAGGAQPARRGGRRAAAALRRRRRAVARSRLGAGAWRSSRAGCSPSRWRSCSPCASRRGQELAACRSCRRGLSEDDARALLDSAIRGRLDERVRDRIVAETRGNPLALLELPRGLTPAELAGGFGLLARRRCRPHRAGFMRQLRRCPRRRSGCCSCGGRAGRRC